jgi:quercetin dioxygenase-like cupin family protein
MLLFVQSRETSMIRRFTAGFAALCLLVVVVMFGAGVVLAQGTPETGTPVASPEAVTSVVFRETLAIGFPPAAPGQTLELVRYDIPAGITLAVHIHPGMQVAYVVSGELTYHVLTGAVEVRRAGDPDPTQPGPVELIEAGSTTVLLPGDSVAELPGAVHYGENLGTEPVVLLAATLLTTGEPAAIATNPEGTPVP